MRKRNARGKPNLKKPADVFDDVEENMDGHGFGSTGTKKKPTDVINDVDENMDGSGFGSIDAKRVKKSGPSAEVNDSTTKVTIDATLSGREMQHLREETDAKVKEKMRQLFTERSISRWFHQREKKQSKNMQESSKTDQSTSNRRKVKRKR